METDKDKEINIDENSSDKVEELIGELVSSLDSSLSSCPTMHPLAYVGNNTAAGNTVTVIDTVTGRIVDIITVGRRPLGVDIGFLCRGQEAWVNNANDNTVSVIDTSTNTVITTIPVGTLPATAAFARGNAYVANFVDNTVSVIDSCTFTPVTTITMGFSNPDGTAATPDGTEVWVTNNANGTVSVINTTLNKVVFTITVGAGNSVSVIDVKTYKVVQTITNARIVAPTSVAISPGGRLGLVANFGSNFVTVIDTSVFPNKVIENINVGAGTAQCAFTPNGKTAFCTIQSLGLLAEIDTRISMPQLIRTISAGIFPRGIAISQVPTFCICVSTDSQCNHFLQITATCDKQPPCTINIPISPCCFSSLQGLGVPTCLTSTCPI
jgi:YVTN family beta-propeller protein